MKNIKNIVIGIFAVIGFGAIVTGFTNETSDPQYPESHVWSVECLTGTTEGRCYEYNKVTGEIRTLSRAFKANDYKVMVEDKK